MNSEKEELESERLWLRRIGTEEARAILAGDSPPGLVFAEGYPSEATLEVLDLLVGSRQGTATGFSPWFVVRKSDAAVIGECGYSFHGDTSRAAAGYSIVEPLRGQGYATEALRSLIAHLFSLPDIEIVEADTFPQHVASRRVMEKAGLGLVGEKQSQEDGEEVTLVVYELRREAYFSPPGV